MEFSVQNYGNTNIGVQRFAAPSFMQRPAIYYAEPQNDSRSEDLGKTALTAGLLQVLSSSLDKVSGWLGNKLVNGKEFTSEDNVKKVVSDMCRDNKLNVDVGLVSRENLPQFVNKYG